MSVIPLEYRGPQCPRCNALLPLDVLHTGNMHCMYCGGAFEATLFAPPQRRFAKTEDVEAAGPSGANACANHARNAAVTSCQRCGLLICSLCDMNIAGTSFCPSCFERVSADGSFKPVATKYRDFYSIARLTAVLGLMLCYFSGAAGAVALYLAPRAFRQRREQGKSTWGMVIVVILACLEILSSIATFGFMAWAFFMAATHK